MAQTFKNPLMEAEPFEESQGRQATASPDELNRFYSDMEKREQTQRRLSRNKSAARPRWSRGRSFRTSLDQTQHAPDDNLRPTPVSKAVTEARKSRGKDTEDRPMLEEERRVVELVDPSQPRSVIPDVGPSTGVALPPHSVNLKSRYNVHNPVGPRWYKNHHLIPPQSRVPLSSSFSPSFPPIRTSIGLAQFEEAEQISGPSRSPSGSPVATPDSSQTRIGDGAPGSRSRKVSQTAHDGVDLLDGTDPWGTNWHHQSPYDVGLKQSQALPPKTTDGPTRSRHKATSHNSGQSHRKAATPSPLSQSTSAVHLQTESTAVTVPRRLSKKRKTGILSLFGGSEQPEPITRRITGSASANDSSRFLSPANGDAFVKRKLSKRSLSLPHSISTGPTVTNVLGAPPVAPSHTVEKREKRGSVFGRLGKKLSVLRRPMLGPSAVYEAQQSREWEHIDAKDVSDEKPAPNFQGEEGPSRRSASPEKPSTEPHKGSDLNERIGPPQYTEPPMAASIAAKKEADGRSSTSISVEASFPTGKLTIANPDDPGSGATTPTKPLIPLPFGDTDRAVPSSSEQKREALPDNHVQEPRVPSSPQRSPVKTSPNHSVETPSSLLHPPVVNPKWEIVNPMTLTPSPGPSIAALPPVVQHPDTPRSTSKPTALMLTNSDRTSADHSPGSKASILANPPTPLVPPMQMPPLSSSSAISLPAPMPERKFDQQTSLELPSAKSQSRARDENHDVKPSTRKDKGKQTTTETFRLVPSSSENVRSNSETIIVGEQQWTVVETPESSRRRSSKEREKSKSKDLDAPRRKESRRQDSGRNGTHSDLEKHNDQEPYRRTFNRGHQTKDVPDSSNRLGRPRSVEISSSTEITPPEPPPKSAPVVPEKDRSDKRREETKRTSSPVPNSIPRLDKALAPLPPVTGAQSNHSASHSRNPHSSIPSSPLDSKPVERRSSIQRPVSDVPVFADLSSLTAREAWEADRMWKGKSVVYGPDVIGVVSSSNGPVHTNTPLRAGSGPPDMNGARPDSNYGIGSSHTSFMMQRPFEGQGVYQGSFYSQLPVPPPPSLYSPPTNSTSHYGSPGLYDYPNTYRSFPDSVAFPTLPSQSSITRPIRSNPLPEPPRMSTYTPPPLPARYSGHRTGDSDPSSAEYWTKYAGITPAH